MEINKLENSFSIILLTAWKAIQKQEQNDAKRLEWKIALIRKLLEAGYKQEKIEIFRKEVYCFRCAYVVQYIFKNHFCLSIKSTPKFERYNLKQP